MRKWRTRKNKNKKKNQKMKKMIEKNTNCNDNNKKNNSACTIKYHILVSQCVNLIQHNVQNIVFSFVISLLCFWTFFLYSINLNKNKTATTKRASYRRILAFTMYAMYVSHQKTAFRRTRIQKANINRDKTFLLIYYIYCFRFVYFRSLCAWSFFSLIQMRHKYIENLHWKAEIKLSIKQINIK